MFLTRASSCCYDALLTLVYPQACAICHRSVESRAFGTVCHACWSSTRPFVVVCWKCGVPALAATSSGSPELVHCHRCDDDKFDVARACGAYEGALRACVLQLKRDPNICRKLVEQLSRTFDQTPLKEASLVVPVPLHPEREKSRGFNQATMIARELARSVDLPLHDSGLARLKHVQRHRAGMDAKGRRDTVASAFSVVQPAVFAGERILLVDDVFTTGATVSACAEALKDASAERVFVLTIARAI